jgi:hypothetical protein
MSSTGITIELHEVQAEISRMAAAHRALLDELASRLRALDAGIARVRAAAEPVPLAAQRRSGAAAFGRAGGLGDHQKAHA